MGVNRYDSGIAEGPYAASHAAARRARARSRTRHTPRLDRAGPRNPAGRDAHGHTSRRGPFGAGADVREAPRYGARSDLLSPGGRPHAMGLAGLLGVVERGRR